jgi:hypothetical protein
MTSLCSGRSLDIEAILDDDDNDGATYQASDILAAVLDDARISKSGMQETKSN